MGEIRVPGTLKVLLPAFSIPNDATVMKKTGSTPYTLRDQFTIYPLSGGKQVLNAEDGTRFLIPKGNVTSISCISSTTELLWVVDTGEFSDFLQEHFYSHK